MKLFCAVLLATAVSALVLAVVDPGSGPDRTPSAPGWVVTWSGDDDDAGEAQGEGLERLVWFLIGLAAFPVVARLSQRAPVPKGAPGGPTPPVRNFD